jgi:hypothetical protein
VAARTFKFALALLVLAGCRSADDGNISADDAMEVANGHFSEVLPQVPLSRLRIEAIDLNEKWLILYHLPEGSTGGRPLVIEVDKRTGRIVLGLR